MHPGVLPARPQWQLRRVPGGALQQRDRQQHLRGVVRAPRVPHEHRSRTPAAALRSPSGQYADTLGSRGCTECPAGRFGEGEGLTTASCSGSDGTELVCAAGWIQHDDGDGVAACYKHYSDSLNWDNSRAVCHAQGAELASVTSANTLAFLVSLCAAGGGGVSGPGAARWSGVATAPFAPAGVLQRLSACQWPPHVDGRRLLPLLLHKRAN